MARSNFESSRKTNGAKKRLIALILALIAAGSGYGAYEVASNSNTPEEVTYTNEAATKSNVENEYSYMKNEETEKIYDTATSEIAALLDSMDFDNDVQYFYAFYLYLEDGLFSETNNINYTTGAKYIDDFNALGLDCIVDKNNTGKVTCVCRHKDALFSDVLNKSNMGFESYSTTCRLEKNIGDAVSSEKPNHQITVVNYNNDVKYYDVSNGAVADKYISNSTCVETDNNALYYKLMPEDTLYDHSYITKHNSIDEVNRINDLATNDNATMSNDEIQSEYKIAYEKMVQNEDAVENFKITYKDDVLDKLKTIKKS